MEKMHISHIDLIKIDTEGHELAVLKGASQAISNGMIEAFQIEFNEMNVYSRSFFRDFYDILKEYTIFRLLPDGMIPLDKEPIVLQEIFAFQNIVALRKNVGT